MLGAGRANTRQQNCSRSLGSRSSGRPN